MIDDASREPAAILARRAAELARPIAEDHAEDEVEILVLHLAREAYGVPAAAVHRILSLESLTRLPGAPPQVAGVTSWEGELLTVLDVRGLLGLPQGGLPDNHRVLVVEAGTVPLGIIVDEVDTLRRVPRSDIRDAPEGVAPNRQFLVGVTPDALAVLDVRALAQAHMTRNES